MEASETQVSLSSRNRLAFRLDCLHEGFFMVKAGHFLLDLLVHKELYDQNG